MRIDVISGLPNLLRSPLEESIIKKAIEKKLADVHLHNLRDYATDKHRTIDDSPYGGGAGMILKPDPIFKCIEKLKSERTYDEIIYLTPAGIKYTQRLANELSLKENILLLCGHYKGIDQRVIDKLITKEISIGDYVLTGGEIPALVLIDSIIRLIPGAIGDSESLLSDSFQEDVLDAPYYTRPSEYQNMKIPEVLLNGNHSEIQKWREQEAKRITSEKRSDILDRK